jgi:hypothetical protein
VSERRSVSALYPNSLTVNVPIVLAKINGGCAYTNASSVLAEGFGVVILRNSATNGSMSFGREGVQDLPNCTESLTQYVQMRRTRGPTASARCHASPPTAVLHHDRSHIHTKEAALVHEVEPLPLHQLLVVSVP